jgi:hypothetical protein
LALEHFQNFAADKGADNDTLSWDDAVANSLLSHARIGNFSSTQMKTMSM